MIYKNEDGSIYKLELGEKCFKPTQETGLSGVIDVTDSDLREIVEVINYLINKTKKIDVLEKDVDRMDKFSNNND